MSSATSGNMTWGQIRKAYIEASGDSTSSRQEAFAHLSQGFREVVQNVDQPEVYQEANFEIPEDPLQSGRFMDFIEVDENVYNIESVFNLTVSAPVYFEPSGMRGRDRYIDANPDIPTTSEASDVFDDPKPPPGQVRWWVRWGNRIYVRDAPDRSTKLRIRYRIQPDPITEEDINSHPFTPAHLDFAIAWLAASNYYTSHRDQNTETNGMMMSQYYRQQGQALLDRPRQVEAQEEKDSFHRTRVAGYRATPRSKRGGYG